MIDFSTLQSLTIPEGEVDTIEAKGKVLWKRYNYHYVSLGDSIAAGHSIDADWANNYGEGSQYGVNGNKSTVIVPNSYTDLIRAELEKTYGSKLSVKSFARSGDTVANLLSKIRENSYKNPLTYAIRNANIVTVCIGANDILIPALEHFDDYVIGGQQALDDIGTQIDNNWGNFESSYATLLTELKNLNSKAKFIFTTVYNPYKYLWLEEGTEEGEYLDGFFGPLMWLIPHQVLGDETASKIRKAFLNTDAVKTLYNRVNSMSAWVEKYVTKLNNTITDKIAALNNPNFKVADTKKVFESFPDRQINADKHYNDLVSVEFTRGFTVEKMDWEQFWENITWADVLTNIENIASNIVNNIITNVIIPDVDPHPETYGQYVMMRAFEDILHTFDDKSAWRSLTRYTISFGAGSLGTGEMAEQEVAGLDGTVFVVINPNKFIATTEGYYHNGWSGATHQDGYYYISLNSDTALEAQWSNMYRVNFYKDANDYAKGVYSNTTFYPGGLTEQTGNQDLYGVYIRTESGDVVLDTSYYRGKFGWYRKRVSSKMYPYGTKFLVWVTYDHDTEWNGFDAPKYKKTTAHVYHNGTLIKAGYEPTDNAQEVTVHSNTDITFECVLAGTFYIDATSNWNCYINN